MIQRSIHILVFFLTMTLCGSGLAYNVIVTPDQQKEIIFVNINDELNEQLSELSEHVYSSFINHENGRIQIQVFTSEEGDIQIVDDLLNQILNLGVERDKVKINLKEMKTSEPYIAISIWSYEDVGYSIGF